MTKATRIQLISGGNMRRLDRNPLILFIFAISVLVKAQTAFAKGAPLSEKHRAKLGQVGVATVRFSPAIELKGGAGAAAEARRGRFIGWSGRSHP